jgi:hypothetical protein
MRDDPPQPADPLDDLLAQARWPQSPQALRRLERTWQDISPVRYARRRSWGRLALAAAIMIAMGAGIVIVLMRRPVARPVVIVVPQPPPTTHVDSDRPTLVASNAPTPLQQLLIAQELAKPPRLAANQAATAVREAIATLGSDPTVEPQPLVAGLKKKIAPEVLHTLLRQSVRDSVGLDRAAAIRLIASAGNEQAVADLLPLLSEMDTRPEALAAICRLADIPTLQRLLGSASNHLERRQIIAAMLGRDPAAAMPQYLRLVENARSRSDALEALDDLPRPPADELMAALRSPQISVRLAAARALGHIDGPQTTAELVALVSTNISRREAMAALLYSKGDDARAAVAGARQSRELALVVQSVQVELRQLN